MAILHRESLYCCLTIDHGIAFDLEHEEFALANNGFGKGEDPPDAIFVTNNRMTTGALHALMEYKILISDDVSLVGFDDLPWADIVSPSITTVRQPSYEMGTAAARKLIERLEGYDSAPQTIVFHPELIVLGSSVKARTVRPPLKRKTAQG